MGYRPWGHKELDTTKGLNNNQSRRMPYSYFAAMPETVQNGRQSPTLLSSIQNTSAICDNFHILDFAKENPIAYVNSTVGLTFQFQD